MMNGLIISIFYIINFIPKINILSIDNNYFTKLTIFKQN